MHRRPRAYLIFPLAAALLATWVPAAGASHSWGGYHWARKTTTFTLKLGDNASSAWDASLVTASADWTTSTVVDTTVVAGMSSVRRCPPTTGRVEVCNKAYGANGWLGLGQIYLQGTHVTAGTVKLNDTYFATAAYNTPAWRNLVMCQEIGHTLGLDHQDENNYNPPLGSCMDYSSDPVPNQHPNDHDFAQLAQIYAHLDTTTTVAGAAQAGAAAPSMAEAQWGRAERRDRAGRPSRFVNDLGGGRSVVTFVIWA